MRLDHFILRIYICVALILLHLNVHIFAYECIGIHMYMYILIYLLIERFVFFLIYIRYTSHNKNTR